MKEILYRQLAIDYCCTPDDVIDGKNHFTVHQYMPGRRRFQEGGECFLKIAVVNGKLLFTGQKSIIDWCFEQYENARGEWFFEAKTLRRLNDRLHADGYQIEMIHPFFIAEKQSVAKTGDYKICWYEGEEIEQFRGDSRFNEAYTFCESAPDVIGVAAIQNERIIGMAGASADSPTMWQIGINVENDARRCGVGKMLVALLKNEILKRGILPYYGTAMSHVASQKVALGTGFDPAWVELVTSKVTQSP